MKAWQNEYAKGTVAPSELARMPTGTICIYQADDKTGCNKLQGLIHSNLKRAGTKFKTQLLYGFNIAGEPFYLIHTEVLEQGKPKLVKLKRNAAGMPICFEDMPE